jgi:disulfide bond formation protein DsbB
MNNWGTRTPAVTGGIGSSTTNWVAFRNERHCLLASCVIFVLILCRAPSAQFDPMRHWLLIQWMTASFKAARHYLARWEDGCHFAVSIDREWQPACSLFIAEKMKHTMDWQSQFNESFSTTKATPTDYDCHKCSIPPSQWRLFQPHKAVPRFVRRVVARDFADLVRPFNSLPLLALNPRVIIWHSGSDCPRWDDLKPP